MFRTEASDKALLTITKRNKILFESLDDFYKDGFMIRFRHCSFPPNKTLRQMVADEMYKSVTAAQLAARGQYDTNSKTVAYLWAAGDVTGDEFGSFGETISASHNGKEYFFAHVDGHFLDMNSETHAVYDAAYVRSLGVRANDWLIVAHP